MGSFGRGTRVGKFISSRWTCLPELPAGAVQFDLFLRIPTVQDPPPRRASGNRGPYPLGSDSGVPRHSRVTRDYLRESLVATRAQAPLVSCVDLKLRIAPGNYYEEAARRWRRRVEAGDHHVRGFVRKLRSGNFPCADVWSCEGQSGCGGGGRGLRTPHVVTAAA